MLLAGDAVAYRKRIAAMRTTASQNFATVLGCHSLAEAMLIHSPAIGGLECSFHLSILFIIIRILIRAAKIEPFF